MPTRPASPRVSLDSPVTALRGIGPTMAARLAPLGIVRVEDLLFHLPSRYQDRRQLHAMGRLQAGQEAAVLGEILDIRPQPGRRPQWCVVLGDDRGAVLQLRFFHWVGVMRSQWRPGRRLWCFGEVRVGGNGLEMVHPEWQLADTPDFCLPDRLTPFYPSVAGITQAHWRAWTDAALALSDELLDPLLHLLPAGWPSLKASLYRLHRSADAVPGDADPARQRLALDELLAHYLALREERRLRRCLPAPVLAAPGAYWERLRQTLPFVPTAAQLRVIAEIRADLGATAPMRRLVQGDVGSGKTLVAVAALLQAVVAGYQVALMAPTEILARQLHQRLEDWLQNLGLRAGLLLGSCSAKERRPLLRALADGELAIVCGTQALFQEGVDYARLGLVIIDEQHRFGVEQRRRLMAKGSMPHLLILTATPIPRTLAMTLHADLDLSVIDSLPPGRQPVATVVLPDTRRDELIARMRNVLAEGRQIYWVCQLIENSELLELQAAEDSYTELCRALPEVRIGLVHGRLPAEEKQRRMRDFVGGATQILVATTVIEVGVDVPAASLMIIEHAERLGLSQLHQLRGRVGRGATQSACILLYRPPLSARARQRLQVIRSSHDGFFIARKDLEMRGPGELLGVRQSGERALRVADPLRDEALLEIVPDLGENLLRTQPEAAGVLIRRWLGSSVAYGDVG
ncbi:ATP-dependent DNA helicase RecG [Acidithiobacillus caldus]|nr:ATP-dependent DNA helicase RecG [Acidithiobacillus caldus]